MSLDRLSEFDARPGAGDVVDGELAVTDDVLVKAFALGPGAAVEPHEHAESTNVFHVVEGTVVVLQDDEEAQVRAPGVVLNERGQAHGLRNESDERAVVTASLCPLP